MSLTTLTVLAVLASSVSAMDNQIPYFLPEAFPLPNSSASTCQTLCKISPDCQYFVWMNLDTNEDFGDMGTCHFGKRPITTAIGVEGFYSGTPDGPILPNTIVLADIEMIIFIDDRGAEDCYRLCLDTEDCHHWSFIEHTKYEYHEWADDPIEVTTWMCYLDSRKDIRGDKMIPIQVGGDRNTPPPAEDTPPEYPWDTTGEHTHPEYYYDTAPDTETGAGAKKKKTQKKQPKKKPQPSSNPATKLTQSLFGTKA